MARYVIRWPMFDVYHTATNLPWGPLAESTKNKQPDLKCARALDPALDSSLSTNVLSCKDIISTTVNFHYRDNCLS